MADVDEFAAWISPHTVPGADLGFFRSGDFKDAVKKLKTKWNKKCVLHKPCSLKVTAVYSILKNRERFNVPVKPNSSDKNIIKNLPTTLKVELLAVVRTFLGVNNNEMLKMGLQLLDEHITNFKYAVYTNNSPSQLLIFKHMFSNCPKVQEIEITSQVLEAIEDHLSSQELEIDEFFLQMADRWRQLRFLSFKAELDTVQNRFVNIHKIVIHAVCANLPELRGLEMCVYYWDFTLNEVKLLSQMQHLKELNLTFDNKPNPTKKQLSIVVQTAGMLPALEKFAFDFLGSVLWPSYYANFVDQFGRRFPAKKITIKTLRISKDLSRPWPELLTVENLNLHNLRSITNILAMESPVHKLHLTEMRPQFIHMLVEKFGPELVDLDFQLIDEVQGVVSELDMFRVISACPKVAKINILIDLAVLLRSTISRVTPAHFKNCKIFTLSCYGIDFEDDDPYVGHLYKMFLLGSEHKVKSLDLMSYLYHMKAIDRALDQPLQTCTLLSELQHVSFLHISSCEMLLHQAFKTILKLYKLSNCLEYVNVRRESAKYFECEVPLWFCEVMDAFGLKVICESEET